MTMRLIIDESIARQLVEHSRERHPEEACGLLFGRVERGSVRVSGAVSATNIHPRPDRAFQVDWNSLLDGLGGRSGGHALVGFYHSHPNGIAEPSADDTESAWPGLVMVICTEAAQGERTLSAWWRGGPSTLAQSHGTPLTPLHVEFA